MVTDADGLTKSDPLAAEQKAQEARQFAQAQKLTLSGQQTIVLAGVDLAVDEKYGVQRQLRRTEYGKLAGFAGAYAAAGESAKAAQLSALLADGDQALVDKAAKDKAAAAAADAKAKADQQQQKASELAAAFDKARQALKDGGVDAGLKVRHDIFLQAVAAKLNGDQAVIALDEADLAFMDKDVRQALADAGYSGWLTIEDNGLPLEEFSKRLDLIIAGK